MKDISTVSGDDLAIVDALTPKAKNVLQVQLGTLEYNPDFGVDLEFFLDPDLQFQNDSFKSYLIQRLSEHHVNVNQVLEALSTFVLDYTFVVGEPESSGGMIS